MIITFYYVIYVYCVYIFSCNFNGGGALAPPIDKPPLVVKVLRRLVIWFQVKISHYDGQRHKPK